MNKKGFTLTEILIVLVVAGILLALILPNTLKAIQRGEATQVRSDLNTIQVGMFMCFTEERSWGNCNTLALLGQGDYVDTELTDNVAAENPFGITYGIKADPDGSTGYVSCYNPTKAVPDDIDSDTSLNKC